LSKVQNLGQIIGYLYGSYTNNEFGPQTSKLKIFFDVYNFILI